VIGLEGAARDATLIPQIQEKGANLLLAEQIGRAQVVGRKPPHGLDVDVLGPLGKAGKLHVVDHTLTHGVMVVLRPDYAAETAVPAPEQIPPLRFLRRSRSVQLLRKRRKRIRRCQTGG
jgi:hypothetical protein